MADLMRADKVKHLGLPEAAPDTVRHSNACFAAGVGTTTHGAARERRCCETGSDPAHAPVRAARFRRDRTTKSYGPTGTILAIEGTPWLSNTNSR